MKNVIGRWEQHQVLHIEREKRREEKRREEKRREKGMGSRLGRRVVHFPNLPVKLLMPSPPFDSIREIALKTIPSATKIEIRRILESLYGFQIDQVRTLNMEGKKKKRGPFLAAKPDYKKAFITLRYPLSLNPNLFPIPSILQDRHRISQASSVRSRQSSVVDERKGHWLDDDADPIARHRTTNYPEWRKVGDAEQRGTRRDRNKEEVTKFPWSSMRKWS